MQEIQPFFLFFFSVPHSTCFQGSPRNTHLFHSSILVAAWCLSLLPGPKPLSPHPPNLLPFLTSLSSWAYVEPGSSFLSWGSTV